MLNKIIPLDRSIVPACDFDLDTFEEVVKETADIEKIGGYKIGPALTGRPGYDKVVEVAKKYTDKPLILDSQKWGTDIPDTAEKILRPVKESGIDAVILFPQSGPATEYEWIKTAQDLGLGVIVGGEMTHPRYLEGDDSEGKDVWYSEIFRKLGIERKITGFIRESAPRDMYEIAARMEANNFVVPGNKPEAIKIYRQMMKIWNIEDDTYWSPGLVAQGGETSKGAKAAGKRFHAIIGRGIYKEKDKRKAAIDLTSQL